MTDVENSTGNNDQAAADEAVKQLDKADTNKKPKAAKASAAGKKPGKKPGKAGAGLLWLFVLITLAVSGAALWGVYTLSQKSETHAVSQDDLLEQSQTAIIDLRDDLGGLDSKIDDNAQQQMSALDGTKDVLGLLGKTVEKQARHIKELSASNRDEWLISEVEYLLRLANQRILMSKDSGSALAMLESADKVLQGIDDLSLHGVRKAMADDMASLRTLEQLDIDGMYLELSALASALDGLELYEIPEFGLGEIETEAMTDEQAAWQDRVKAGFAAIGASLERAFVVRRDGESVEAMLPPQEELYLRQNLRLMLEQAQLALLSRKPEIYKNSLDKAQRWLAQYFLTDKNGTQQALQSIGELATINVDPPLPDISGSFRALKKYQQNQLNARPGLEGYEAKPAAVIKEPLAGEKPSAGEEPLTDNASSADEEPSAEKEPSAGEKPLADQKPSANEKPLIEDKPSVEAPSANKEQAPATIEQSTEAATRATTVEEPAVEKPSTENATLLDKVMPVIEKILPGSPDTEKAPDNSATPTDQSAQKGA